jgi:hypothetical protein
VKRHGAELLRAFANWLHPAAPVALEPVVIREVVTVSREPAPLTEAVIATLGAAGIVHASTELRAFLRTRRCAGCPRCRAHHEVLDALDSFAREITASQTAGRA